MQLRACADDRANAGADMTTNRPAKKASAKAGASQSSGQSESEDRYAWINPTEFTFFDEGAGESKVDLMGFTYDEEAAHEMLDRIITKCRGQLSALDSDGARAILRLADVLLDAMKDHIIFRNESGERVYPDSVAWKKINHLDVIHSVVSVLGSRKIQIGDEGSDEIFEVTPARFCAAFALKMAFNASRAYLSSDESRDLREYYIAQAAVAYGYMESMRPDRDDGIAKAIAESNTVSAARLSAERRWTKDPKAVAMRDVRDQWDAMQAGKVHHRSDAQFARDMMKRHGGDLSEGGIKNAISRWRREL